MSNTKNDEVIQELTAEDIAQISGGNSLTDTINELAPLAPPPTQEEIDAARNSLFGK